MVNCSLAKHRHVVVHAFVPWVVGKTNHITTPR